MNFFVAAVVCIVAVYGVDAIWFGGQYFDTLQRLMSNIMVHLR